MKNIYYLLTLILIVTLPRYSIHASPGDVVAGKIVSIQGELSISKDGGRTWLKAEIGQILYEGDVLRTGDYDKGAILLSDETQMKIHPKSEILIKSIQRYELKRVGIPIVGITAMHVEKGQGWFRAKRPDAKFKVTTPVSFAGIRGTEINVSFEEEKEEAIVTVVEGIVEYGNEVGTIVLRDGDQGIIRRGQAPQKVTLVNPEDAVQWSLYYMGMVSYRDYPFITSDREILRQRLAEIPLSKIEEAKIYHDLGELDKAEEILADMKANDEVNTLFGWIYLERRELDNAITYLDKVRRDSVYSILGKSKVYYLKDQIQKALDVILKADYQDSPELLTQLGYIYLSRGLVDEALDYLQKAIDVSPEYGLAYGFLSNFYIVTNRVDLAEDAARKALDYSPYSPSAHIDMSIIYQALFDLELAKEYARKAVDLDPTNPYALYQYAKILFGFGYNREAETQILLALQYHPDDSLINTLYGFIVFAQGRTDEAIDIFKLAVKLDSTQGQPHLGLGLSYFRKKKYDEGIEEMLMATLLEPKVSLNQSYLGKSYYQAKRFTEAGDAIDYAKKLDPLDPTPYLYGGNIKRELYEYVAAVEDIQESIKLNDNRAVYRSRLLLDKDKATRSIDLAETYRKLGLHNWAYKEALKSLESDITNGSAHLFYATTLSAFPARTIAFISELTKAYFLMPVNQNTFNSYNDYTSMLEIPYNRFAITQEIGEYNLKYTAINGYGGSGKYAYKLNATYETNGGLRGLNDFERIRRAAITLKTLLSQNSDLYLQYSAYNSTYILPTRLEIFDDPFNRSTDRFESHTIQAGYHKKLRPGSDILLFGEFRDVKMNDRDYFFGEFYDLPLYFELLQTKFTKYNIQATHMLDLGSHQLQYGFDYFYNNPVDSIFKRQIGTSPSSVPQVDKDIDRNSSLYIQDIWSIRDRFDLIIGGEYKYVNEGNITYHIPGTDNVAPGVIETQFNPRIGFKYEISDKTILRGAAFRTLETRVKVNMSPTDIAGFILPGGIGTFGTTDKKEYNLAIEHQFDNKTFGFMSFQYRDTDTPMLKDQSEPESTIYKKIDLRFERILNRYMTFETFYHHDNFDVSEYRREDHYLGFAFTLNFWNGWRIRIYEEWDDYSFDYLDESFRGSFEDNSVWQTGISIEKEFPEKMGAVYISLSNIFDEKFDFPIYPGEAPSLGRYRDRFYWRAYIEFWF